MNSTARAVRGRGWAALAIALLLAGCAGTKPAARVAEPEPSPASGPDGVRVNVELAAPADVSKPSIHSAGEGLRQAGKLTGLMIAAGGAATLLAGPAGASAAVVGVGMTLLLSPVLFVEGSLNASQREAVLRAIEVTDFPARLRRALERRLAREGGLRLDVAIHSYGFVNGGPGGSRFCFTTSASIDAAAADRVLLHEDLVMSPAHQSEDVPPTECAGLGDIAADDGRVARRVLGDAAEILAAVIVKHVKASR